VIINPLGSVTNPPQFLDADSCPQVVNDDRLHGDLLGHAIVVFLRLAYNTCQVPNSYKIDRSLAFNVDPTVFASGRFSDIRRGNLGGQLVAVKTIRMFVDSDTPGIQKVDALNSFFFVPH